MATVLVIEDDAVSQRLLKSLLTKRAHKAYITSTISEGLEELERHTLIDLVVLDNQLKGEFGWQFLQRVRQDFVFQHIPVIVYSASSDRNSVLRYLQLGVQKILVKPYSAKNLEDEIENAVKRDWRGMIFEPVDRVCQRLSISEDDYFKSLSNTATDTLERITHLNRLVGRANSAEFRNHLSLLNSSAVNLGISILENATEAIQQSADEDRLDQCIFQINRLVPTARLLQHRALTHFGMVEGNSEIPDSFLLNRQGLETPDIAEEQRRPAISAERIQNRTTDQLHSVLNNPLYAYTGDLAILQEKQLFRPDEIYGTVLYGEPRPPIRALEKNLHILLNAENQGLDQFREHIQEMPWLAERIRRLAAMNEGQNEIINLDLTMAVQKLGMSTCASIFVTHDWLRQAREDKNPLYLESLAQHTLGVALLTRELSRKFPVEGFMVAAIARDIGRWILALQYPAFYGLGLSFGKNDPDGVHQSLRKLFGLDSAELGAECLRHWNIPERYAMVAASGDRIENTPAGDARTIAAIVHLARILAGLHGIGYCGQRTAHEERDFTESNAWSILKKEGHSIPLAPTEYLSAFQPVITRIRRQINLLFE